MNYEIFKQGPAVYIPYFLVSLMFTILIYSAFPVIFAKARKASVTKKNTHSFVMALTPP